MNESQCAHCARYLRALATPPTIRQGRPPHARPLRNRSAKATTAPASRETTPRSNRIRIHPEITPFDESWAHCTRAPRALNAPVATPQRDRHSSLPPTPEPHTTPGHYAIRRQLMRATRALNARIGEPTAAHDAFPELPVRQFTLSVIAWPAVSASQLPIRQFTKHVFWL